MSAEAGAGPDIGLTGQEQGSRGTRKEQGTSLGRIFGFWGEDKYALVPRWSGVRRERAEAQKRSSKKAAKNTQKQAYKV